MLGLMRYPAHQGLPSEGNVFGNTTVHTTFMTSHIHTSDERNGTEKENVTCSHRDISSPIKDAQMAHSSVTYDSGKCDVNTCTHTVNRKSGSMGMDCPESTVSYEDHVASDSSDSDENPNEESGESESEGGWISETDDKCSKASDSDSEVELPPGLPNRTGHSIVTEKKVSDARRFHRQGGMLVTTRDEAQEDVDETWPDIGSLFDNDTPLDKGSSSCVNYEDFEVFSGKPASSSLNYAFPKCHPTDINEVVSFWEIDFQTGHLITPCMGSWEAKGIAPHKSTDITAWKRYMVYKALYAKWLQCHQNEKRWCMQYWSMSLYQILKQKTLKASRKVKAEG